MPEHPLTHDFWNTVAAELIKLRTLPAIWITSVATGIGVTGLAVMFTVSGERPSGPLTATLLTVQYGQIGLILIGILSVATEYDGGQIRATLTGVPNRMLLLAGKVAAYLVTASLTALLCTAAALACAHLASGGPPAGWNGGALLGAVAYLVLIGLLAHAVAVLTRQLIAALVTMLALVFVLPPFLTAVTTLANYLPGLAGGQMYRIGSLPRDGLTPLGGAAVLGVWLALALTAASVSFAKRDA